MDSLCFHTYMYVFVQVLSVKIASASTSRHTNGCNAAIVKGGSIVYVPVFQHPLLQQKTIHSFVTRARINFI